MAGCLKWLCGQSRPELSPYVSLSNRGSQTTYGDLKNLYAALEFARGTSDCGRLLPDIPLSSATTFLSFADASGANYTPELRSQFGVLIFATVPQVSQVPCVGLLLDWKSGKSQRVARSSLVAEAMAADEAVDRTYYLNLFLSETLTGTPAHRVEPVFQHLRTTDAKSLYDVLISESPNLTEKRSLVNVRAVQEVLFPNQLHWIPTHLMRARCCRSFTRGCRNRLSFSGGSMPTKFLISDNSAPGLSLGIEAHEHDAAALSSRSGPLELDSFLLCMENISR